MAKITKTSKFAPTANGKQTPAKAGSTLLERVRVITPVGRILYPHLLEPHTEGKYATNKYQTDILFSKDTWKEQSLPLRGAVLKAGRALLGKPKATLEDFKNPFKDGDDKDQDVFQGNIIMTPRSQFKPTVVGPDKVAFSDERIRAIKGGDWVRLVLSVYPYSQQGGGITCGLEVVQFAREGEAIGGGRGAALELLDEMEVELEDPTDEGTNGEDHEEEMDDDEEDMDEEDGVIV